MRSKYSLGGRVYVELESGSIQCVLGRSFECDDDSTPEDLCFFNEDYSVLVFCALIENRLIHLEVECVDGREIANNLVLYLADDPCLAFQHHAGAIASPLILPLQYSAAYPYLPACTYETRGQKFQAFKLMCLAKMHVRRKQVGSINWVP